MSYDKNDQMSEKNAKVCRDYCKNDIPLKLKQLSFLTKMKKGLEIN